MNGRLEWRSPRRVGRLGLVAASVLALSSCISLASTASDGTQGNADAENPSISADGRFVAFDSKASNLIPGDELSSYDVFVKDFTTGTTTAIKSSTAQNEFVFPPAPVISGDGSHVAFIADGDLVPQDTNDNPDVYSEDLSTGALQLVNTSTSGQQAVGATIGPVSVSSDGRFVAFWSVAENLVPGPSNGTPDIFVKDLATGQTTAASTDSNGAPTGSASTTITTAISGDGRYVVFSSDAATLAPGDTNGVSDGFVKDRTTGTTTRVTTAGDGTQGNGASAAGAISPDGRYVVFTSAATNLVPGDTNGVSDVFVKDRTTGATTRVSTAGDGSQSNAAAFGESISGDGRYVTFESSASNLVPGDTNGVSDVFVKDLTTGTITRVDAGANGAEADGTTDAPVISTDGRFVAFESGATNLVSGDTNGVNDVFRADRP